jgi:uncharacterized protein DUF5655
MATPSTEYSVAQHFDKSEPAVQATYEQILKAARKLGPVTEEAKKTSIHLVRKTAFGGVVTRKAALILTLKSDTDLASKRIIKREQVSAGRWHLEVRLESPGRVDRELIAWLKKAYELAG